MYDSIDLCGYVCMVMSSADVLLLCRTARSSRVVKFFEVFLTDTFAKMPNSNDEICRVLFFGGGRGPQIYTTSPRVSPDKNTPALPAVITKMSS